VLHCATWWVSLRYWLLYVLWVCVVVCVLVVVVEYVLVVLPLGVVWVVMCFGSAWFLYWCCLLFGGLIVLFWDFLTCFRVWFAYILVGSYLRTIMCLLLFGVLHNLLGGGWI